MCREGPDFPQKPRVTFCLWYSLVSSNALKFFGKSLQSSPATVMGSCSGVGEGWDLGASQGLCFSAGRKQSSWWEVPDSLHGARHPALCPGLAQSWCFQPLLPFATSRACLMQDEGQKMSIEALAELSCRLPSCRAFGILQIPGSLLPYYKPSLSLDLSLTAHRHWKARAKLLLQTCSSRCCSLLCACDYHRALGLQVRSARSAR